MVSQTMTSTGINTGSSWADQGTSIRMDTMSLVIAVLLHAPLYFVHVDAHKKQIDKPSERLVSVDLVDTLKKEEPAPPPPPAPAPKGNSIKDRLLKLVHKEPPPPAPAVKEKPVEQKLVDAPNKIALAPKLDVADKIAPKLQTKSGFETKADPKLIEQKQLAMNTAVGGIAPLSAKRMGVIENRDLINKSDKGKFAVGTKSVSDIGGDTGPSLAGAMPAQTLAINTAGKSSVEKFSAAPVQKSDKGRIGGVAVPTVGGGPQLGLRDSIIARDAGPGQIAGKAGGVAGGIPGGVPGGTKRDAGRFGGTDGGVAGGVAGGRVGGVVGGTGSSTIASGNAAVARAREKKSMFTITGELSNRQIVRQVTPEYPAWAQAQGVEASVVLEFTVDAEGNVKPNVVVRRTTGYPKLDDSAIRALRQWKFAPLPAGQENKEEVGLITFNYSLS